MIIIRWCAPSAVQTRLHSDTDSLRLPVSATPASRESRKVGFIDVYFEYLLVGHYPHQDVCLTYAQ